MTGGELVVLLDHQEVVLCEFGACYGRNRGSGSDFFISSAGGTATFIITIGPGAVEQPDSVLIKNGSAK